MDIDTSKIDEAALEQMSEAEKRELYKLLERREQLRNQQRAQTDFLTFAEHVWPQFVHGQHHQIVADAFERILQGKLKRLVISLPPRHALALDTVIPTPTGLRLLEDLQVGDYVFGPDGEPTMVEGKSEVFEGRPCWKVLTDRTYDVPNERSRELLALVADEEHRWCVAHKGHEDWHMMTTLDLWRRQQNGYPPMVCPPMQIEINGQTYSSPERELILEQTHPQDTQCIKVDRQDELFIAGHDLLVTSNTKSEMSSWLLPAWYLGHKPDAKILHASHTQDLTANFGRKIRDLIEDPDYKEIFPDTILKTDAKSAGKWQTASGGQYFAAGVGGALAGRGADLCIIDDPISEQDTTDGAFEQCWEWFQSGPRQRLQPGGIIVIIMTRWSKKDLVGRLLRKMEKDPLAERYEYIEFPAVIYEEGHENDDDHALDSLWPEYWPLEDMLAVKRTISPHLWNAQYMQRPTGKGSTLVTKDMIKLWPAEKPLPEMEFLLHSYDPAFEEKESRDPTGFNKWGAFRPVGEFGGKKYDGTQMCFILLGSMKKRMDFPALKRMVIGQYRSDKPDTVVIEKRASGFPLLQELWRAGLFLESFTPHRGTGDKYARLNSVVSMFEEGLVFVLEGPQWAEEFVEDITSFPNAEDDDLVDAAVMALLRFKRGNLVRFQDDDEADEDKLPVRRRLYNI